MMLTSEEHVGAKTMREDTKKPAKFQSSIKTQQSSAQQSKLNASPLSLIILPVLAMTHQKATRYANQRRSLDKENIPPEQDFILANPASLFANLTYVEEQKNNMKKAEAQQIKDYQKEKTLLDEMRKNVLELLKIHNLLFDLSEVIKKYFKTTWHTKTFKELGLLVHKLIATKIKVCNLFLPHLIRLQSNLQSLEALYFAVGAKTAAKRCTDLSNQLAAAKLSDPHQLLSMINQYNDAVNEAILAKQPADDAQTTPLPDDCLEHSFIEDLETWYADLKKVYGDNASSSAIELANTVMRAHYVKQNVL